MDNKWGIERTEHHYDSIGLALRGGVVVGYTVRFWGGYLVRGDVLLEAVEGDNMAVVLIGVADEEVERNLG